jgi:hypothetical protein
MAEAELQNTLVALGCAIGVSAEAYDLVEKHGFIAAHARALYSLGRVAFWFIHIWPLRKGIFPRRPLARRSSTSI